ncbi:MAG: hypothetical protein AAGG08_04335, partial [Actinomycetota bacterium]
MRPADESEVRSRAHVDASDPFRRPPTPDGAPAASSHLGTRPPPVPAPAAPSTSTPPTPRGRIELTFGWRALLGLGWTAGFFAYAAVWQASVQLGIATWWLGPRAQPTPALIRLLPFIICLAIGLVVAYGLRRTSEIAIGGSVLLLAGAVPD